MKITRFPVKTFAILTLAFVTGCGPVMVSKMEIKARTSQFEDATSLAQGLAYADLVRERYRERIRDQILVRRAAGLVGIATLITTSFIGVQGGSSDLALGAALGGGGAFAFSQLSTDRTEQLIYAGGAAAVTCLVGRYEGLRYVTRYSDEMEQFVIGTDPAKPSVPAIRDALAATVRATDISKNTNTARAAIASANTALASGRSALLTLEKAGSALTRDVDDVQNKVDRALIAANIDLAQFLSSLGATVGRFVPTAPGTGEAVPGATGIDTSGGRTSVILTKRLQTLTSQLKALTELVEAAAGSGVTPECTFDPQALVDGALEIAPASLPVTASASALTARFVVSGGRPPYSVGWFGATPSSGYELKMEDSGTGIVFLKVPANAAAAEYRFRATDVRRTNSAAVRISVTGASKPGGGGGGGGDAELTADQKKVQALQTALKNVDDPATFTFIDEKGAEVPLPWSGIVADGKFGAKTRSAALSWLENEATAEDFKEIEKTIVGDGSRTQEERDKILRGIIEPQLLGS